MVYKNFSTGHRQVWENKSQENYHATSIGEPNWELFFTGKNVRKKLPKSLILVWNVPKKIFVEQILQEILVAKIVQKNLDKFRKFFKKKSMGTF